LRRGRNADIERKDFFEVATRSRLKIRIFVRDQGAAEAKPAGILLYVEALRRGRNADIERKDFFEAASNAYR
jgi:hypothetical protein